MIAVIGNSRGRSKCAFMAIKNKEEAMKIECLYNKYKYLMFKIANDILNDYSEAEDAVHQSFVKIINNLHKIDLNDSSKTLNFFAIICSNTAKDIYKKRQNITEFDETDDLEAEGAQPCDIVIDRDSVNRIMEVLKGLPQTYRDTMLLKFAYGYSTSEIAQLLNISKETAKKRITRGRGKVAQILEREKI